MAPLQGACHQEKEKKINFQNQPEEARKLFVPAPGHAFVQGDFSNLELRVMAYEFDDGVLQQQFAEGKNIHDENTRVMFGITPEHKDWEHIRKAAKTAVFGRSYGGGIRGIFERVSAKVPEFNFTMAMFRNADRKYFDAHPKLEVGFKRAAQEALSTRVCITATGRKRFFLSTPDEVEREGINTRIQSPAGDIANESLIDLYEECARHEDWKLLVPVHDSNTVECPIEDVPQCAKIMKSIMEKPRLLWGKTVVFPADIKVSVKSWGEMVSYDKWTKDQAKAKTKSNRGRKHAPSKPRDKR